MAKNWLGFLWRYNTLTSGMALFPLAVNAAVGARLEDLAREMEDYAKSNAPWEDRTGAAREGLGTEVFHEDGKHIIVLYHSVDYGLWLEIRWSGTYAIIMPTIEHFGGQALGGINIGVGGTGADMGELV